MASRKNHTLKLAGILLALVLVTSCFVGGTFAKYVTTGTGSDSARVAKFGVTVTANGTMFAKEYDTNTENVKGTIAKSVVSSNDKEKVVAPGTSGKMVSMTLAGKPEVAVNVRYTANVTLSNNWVYKTGENADEEFYCPITIKVGTDKVGTESICGLDYDNANLFKAAVETAIKNSSANYEPNTDLKTAKAPSVSWAWTFENAGEHKKKQDDVKDTYLGDQAAKGNAATIDLEVVTTVTQID